MGLSPTKPTINLSNRRGERCCDDSTTEPNNIAAITNVTANQSQQSNNINESKEVEDSSGIWLTHQFIN